VFQIESRAQMSMLPRLRPQCFYDLVIQVAIVRPGPIQGDMVHPYLERRRDPNAVVYENEALKPALERTLGVPIFQEQVMQLAQIAAGFTAGEADQLRRAMAAWKRKGGLEPFEQKLFEGMRQRGYSAEFAERIFKQIKGFGDYGFPESHAASFALLAWVSSYLKCHYPAAFTAALVNSQPMGFYRPSQLLQDAQRHGVRVLPIDVQHSDWDCCLAATSHKTANGQPAIRLGLRLVAGLNQQAALRLLAVRMSEPYCSVQDLASRAALSRSDLEALAAADALKSLLSGSDSRYQAFWQVAGVEPPSPLLPATAVEPEPMLRLPSVAEEVVADYQSTGLSVKQHPLALLRTELARRGVCTGAELWQRRSGSVAHVAGLVIGRQRPGTATGVIFVSLEDETGLINVVVWASVAEQQRQALLNSRLLMVSGIVQHEDNVLHLVAGKLTDVSEQLQSLRQPSRDFR
jgi:error-prone DNA polymerase